MFFKSRCCLEISGSTLLRLQSCNKFFSHLMTDFPQIGNRQLIVLHFTFNFLLIYMCYGVSYVKYFVSPCIRVVISDSFD